MKDLLIGKKNKMKNLVIYSDGAYSSLRNQGGWAFVAIQNNIKIHSSFFPIEGGTNNVAEIQSCIEACSWAKKNNYNEFTLITDSQYVIGAITRGNKRNKNIELLAKLDKTIEGLTIIWKHVHGHFGDKYNELCDVLAVTASQS
jgi:ribonuclease HI